MCDDDPPSSPVTTPQASAFLQGAASAPLVKTVIPGPESKSWLLRMREVAAPMGPRPPAGAPVFGTVFARSEGCNVWDVDDNCFIDLAAGFGSMLLGHSHPRVLTAIELQSKRLMQAMGDVYPSDAKIALMQRLTELTPWLESPRCILGQSGADALTAAMKTATLSTGRTKFIAIDSAYHGLSYGPLAACGLRASYREPFAGRLQPDVEFLPLPNADSMVDWEQRLERILSTTQVAAVIAEPIIGRGGVYPLPSRCLATLQGMADSYGTLTVADEVWTGLGRAGHWLASSGSGWKPDLVCLGKGLGGGLPMSAVLGSARVMKSWSREQEVVHTSTFAGAPLACTSALSTLNVIDREDLVGRARAMGERATSRLREALQASEVEVRGQGLMIGVDLGTRPGAAVQVLQQLLNRGYLVSTGGGSREVVVLTPPLTIEEAVLLDAVDVVANVVKDSVQ